MVPLATRDRRFRAHVPVDPPEGGLSRRSFIMCEQARVFAVERRLRWRGSLSATTMDAVEDRLRILPQRYARAPP